MSMIATNAHTNCLALLICVRQINPCNKNGQNRAAAGGGLDRRSKCHHGGACLRGEQIELFRSLNSKFKQILGHGMVNVCDVSAQESSQSTARRWFAAPRRATRRSARARGGAGLSL